MSEEKSTLVFATEIGTFGSMPIKDASIQTVSEISELAKETKDEDLKKFLMEQMKNK